MRTECPALYATSRNPNAPTRTQGIDRMAELLGMELMPWQRQVLETGLEIRADGRPVFKEIVVTVPRQCGKTTIVLLLILALLLRPGARRRANYSAQNVVEATAKWSEELWPLIEHSPLKKLGEMRIRRSIANAGIDANATGCVMNILTGSDSSGHGGSVELNVIDEAHTARSTAREQALVPTMRTKPMGQLWVLSTAGDEDSTYLREKVEAGRERVLAAGCRDAEIAYFEWGLSEAEDWENPANWKRAVPALGYTISFEDLEGEFKRSKPDDFRRAGLNQWPLIASVWGIPKFAWEGVYFQGPQPAGKFWCAAHAPPRQRGAGVIVTCAEGIIECIKSDQGSGWILGDLRALAKTHGTDLEAVGIIERGPLVDIGATLEEEGIPVAWIDWSKTLPSACERFFEAVLDGKLGIAAARRQVLTNAVKESDTRDRQTGAWTWKERGDKSIAALYASTVAYDLSIRQPVVRRHGFFLAAADDPEAYQAYIVKREAERQEWLKRRGLSDT